MILTCQIRSVLLGADEAGIKHGLDGQLAPYRQTKDVKMRSYLQLSEKLEDTWLRLK